MKQWKNPVFIAAVTGLALTASLFPVRAAGILREEAPAETEEEPSGITASFGKAEGALGDTMQASFLKFRLNAASLTSRYQSVSAEESMQLLVLNISTLVTQKKGLMLYDTDYQIQWGGEGETDYAEPVTYRDEWADFTGYMKSVNLDGITSMFPGSAVLAPEEMVTYDYVYQVPAGTADFRLMFKEYFEDESLGDLYIVTFHAESAGEMDGTLGEIVPASGTGVLEEQPAAEETTTEAPAESEAQPQG